MWSGTAASCASAWRTTTPRRKWSDSWPRCERLRTKSLRLRSLRTPQLRDVRSLPDQHHVRHADKQPVLYHAGHAFQLAGQRRKIGNPATAAVQNVMAPVGDEGVSISTLANFNRCAQGRNLLLNECLCERNHFDRQRKFSQHRYL